MAVAMITGLVITASGSQREFGIGYTILLIPYCMLILTAMPYIGMRNVSRRVSLGEFRLEMKLSLTTAIEVLLGAIAFPYTFVLLTNCAVIMMAYAIAPMSSFSSATKNIVFYLCMLECLIIQLFLVLLFMIEMRIRLRKQRRAVLILTYICVIFFLAAFMSVVPNWVSWILGVTEKDFKSRHILLHGILLYLIVYVLWSWTRLCKEYYDTEGAAYLRYHD